MGREALPQSLHSRRPAPGRYPQQGARCPWPTAIRVSWGFAVVGHGPKAEEQRCSAILALMALYAGWPCRPGPSRAPRGDPVPPRTSAPRPPRACSLPLRRLSLSKGPSQRLPIWLGYSGGSPGTHSRGVSDRLHGVHGSPEKALSVVVRSGFPEPGTRLTIAIHRRPARALVAVHCTPHASIRVSIPQDERTRSAWTEGPGVSDGPLRASLRPSVSARCRGFLMGQRRDYTAPCGCGGRPSGRWCYHS
jgi:hypothetical protein